MTVRENIHMLVCLFVKPVGFNDCHHGRMESEKCRFVGGD